MSSLAAAMNGMSWELGAVAVGVAVLVAAAAAAIQSWVSPSSAGVTGLLDRGTSHSDSPTIRLGGLEATKAGAWLSRVLGPLVAVVRPTRSDELSQLRSRLIQAGLRSKHAMEAFLVSKVVLATAATLSFLEINGHQPGGLGFPAFSGARLFEAPMEADLQQSLFTVQLLFEPAEGLFHRFAFFQLDFGHK